MRGFFRRIKGEGSRGLNILWEPFSFLPESCENQVVRKSAIKFAEQTA
jgi:hypothetical protein